MSRLNFMTNGKKEAAYTLSKQYKFLKNLQFMNLGCEYLIKITKRS